MVQVFLETKRAVIDFIVYQLEVLTQNISGVQSIQSFTNFHKASRITASPALSICHKQIW